MKKGVFFCLSVCVGAGLLMSACTSSKKDGTYAYTQTDVEIPANGHVIPATLCIPDGSSRFPAVVMLHGTASNRNEAGDGYRKAAPVLAEKYGIATIRIDFMGNGDSKADYTGYTFTSAVADAVKAAQYIGSLKNIDSSRIGVMGWSQGGTIALLACARHGDIFKSAVTWAGAPKLNDGDFFTEADYKEAQKNGFFVMEFDWRSPLNVSLQWCEDVMNTDVLAEFARFTGPVLAIAGTQDTAVNPEWSTKIKDASHNPKSKTVFIEGMEHTFNVFSEPDFASLYIAVDETGSFFADTL